MEDVFPPPSWFVWPNHSNTMDLKFTRFSKDEISFLSLINGQAAIGSLIENSPFDYQKTREFLLTLILTDMINPSREPLERESPFLGVSPDEMKSTPFSEAFFYQNHLHADKDDPPPITNEELHAELKELEKGEKEKSTPWVFLDDESPSDFSEIGDTDIKGLHVRRSDPIKYLVVVGLCLTALGLIFVSFLMKSSSTDNITNMRKVNGPGTDLAPVFTSAMDLCNIGLELLKTGEPYVLNDAKEAFEKSLEIDPDYQLALEGLKKTEILIKLNSGENPVPDNSSGITKTPTIK